MITKENLVMLDQERVKSKNEVVVDTNIFLTVAAKKENFEKIKDVLELIEGKEIDQIDITSGVYLEVETKKKHNNEDAARVYSWFGKVLYNSEGIYKYEELEKHPDGVDDALIEFAIERNASFVSLDTRCNIRYFAKANMCPKIRLDEAKFIKLMHIVKHLDNLKEGNLSDYLQRIFDSKKMNIVEFIQMEPSERLKAILTLLVEECLKSEDEKFIEEIKQTVLKTKSGEISNKVLMKNLSKLNGYYLGDLYVEESLLEEHSCIIERFLKEKGYESFRDLQKSQPFFTEDELVNKIIKYYEVMDNGGEI